MTETEHRTLDSGLELYIVKRKCPVTHFQLYTPFGGDILEYEDPDTNRVMSLPAGTAHFFEHVLHVMQPLGKDGKPLNYRTNTPKRKKNLRDGLTELENNDAITVNAYTNTDHTNYWFVSRLNPMENLETLLDYVLTVYLPHDRYKKECGTIGDEIGRADNHWVRELYKVWDEQAFHVHGGKHTILGTKESIDTITLDDLISVHSTFYRPSNMGLIVTGDVDGDEIERVVTQKLERMGQNTYQAPPGEVKQGEPDGVVVADNFDNPLRRPERQRPIVLGGWKYLFDPTEMSKDELLSMRAAGDITSLALFEKGSKNRQELIRAGIDERSFDGFNWHHRDRGSMMAVGDTDDPEEFRRLIQECVVEAVENGISSEEIEYARNCALLGEDTVQDNILSLGVALTEWGAKSRNPLDLYKFVERLETITPEEVNELLPRFFKPENATFVLMEPK